MSATADVWCFEHHTVCYKYMIFSDRGLKFEIATAAAAVTATTITTTTTTTTTTTNNNNNNFSYRLWHKMCVLIRLGFSSMYLKIGSWLQAQTFLLMKYGQVLFSVRVTFLKNLVQMEILQIEHKFPI
jgi:hypothetical protein